MIIKIPQPRFTFLYASKVLLLYVLMACHGALLAQFNTQALINQGRHELYNQHFVEANHLFTKVIEQDNQLHEAFFLRGIGKYNLSDILGARSDFKASVELNPFFSNGFHYYAICEDQLGNYAQSLQSYAKAISLRPFDAPVYMNRALVYLKINELNRALSDLDSAIVLNKHSSENYLYRSLVYIELDSNERAMSDVNNAIQLNGFSSRAFLQRAILRTKSNQDSLALYDIEKSILLEPNNLLANYYKANILIKQERNTEGLQQYNLVLDADPSNTLVLYNRAILKIQMGQVQSGLDDFATALIINPRQLMVYFARAQTYFQLGKYSAALKDLNQSLEIYPNFPPAYQLRASVYQQMGRMAAANTDLLMYQQLTQNPAAEAIFKKDSSYIASVMDFDSEFAPSSALANQKIQYRELDVQLMPDVFFMERLVVFDDPIYDQIQEWRIDKRNVQMVYYQKLSSEIVDSLMLLHTSPQPNYYDYFVLGTCYGLRKDYNRSNECFEQSIKLNPKFPYSYANRAYFNSQLNDLLLESPSVTHQLIGTDLVQTSSYPSQQSTQISMVDNQAIIEDLRRSLWYRDDVVLWYNLANNLAIQQQLIEALRIYKQILLKAPNLKWVYFNMALIELKIEDRSAACEHFSKAGELGLEKAYPIILKLCKPAN